MDESLFDKLRSLGVQLGTQRVPRPEPKSRRAIPIDQVLPGEWRSSTLGECFIVNETFPGAWQHGWLDLARATDLQVLLEWANLPELNNLPREKYLFLDTETSGLAGGTGTFAFMIGLGFWTNEGFRLAQLFLRDPSEETGVLANLDEIATQFEVVVTYNGKSFDIPLLNARYTLNALNSPFRQMAHIDLLGLSRRIWRNRLASRTLGNIEAEILKVTRSGEEIPGWMVPEMYFEYLKTLDATPLAGVFYHNKIDILSLAALMLHASELLSHPLETPNPESLDLVAIARLYENINRIEEAATLYERGLTMGLPRPFFIQTLYRLASIARKRADWPACIDLWAKVADYGEFDACIELAKYYEHRVRDINTAVSWTEKARTCLVDSILPLYQKKTKLEELEHRLDRLHGKMKSRERPGTEGTNANGEE